MHSRIEQGLTRLLAWDPVRLSELTVALLLLLSADDSGPFRMGRSEVVHQDNLVALHDRRKGGEVGEGLRLLIYEFAHPNANLLWPFSGLLLPFFFLPELDTAFLLTVAELFGWGSNPRSSSWRSLAKCQS